METGKKMAFEKVGFIAGILICIAFIMYFLLMIQNGWIQVIELRELNFVILSVGLIITYRYYWIKSNRHMEYLNGVGVGLIAIATSMMLFAAFIFIYFTAVDKDLLMLLKNNAPVLGKYLTPFSAALVLLIEGGVSGLILTFSIMQYYKNDPRWVKEEDQLNSGNKKVA